MNQVFCPILVGRRGELAAFESALEDARKGKGRVLLVSGEAGIGKSRLAREAETLATQAGMQVGRGRALDGTDHSPYRPIVEALQSLLRRTSDPRVFDRYRPMLELCCRKARGPEAHVRSRNSSWRTEYFASFVTCPQRTVCCSSWKICTGPTWIRCRSSNTLLTT